MLVGFLFISSMLTRDTLAGSSDNERPNVLFIAVDDLNDWVEGLNDYGAAKTPHISRLAHRGVLFTQAYCAAPACNPSRTSVMTGLRPTTSGVYFNNQDWRECDKLNDFTTLPHCFRSNGYKVLGGGKLYHAASLSQWGHEGYLDPRPWHEFFPSKSQQLPAEITPDSIPLNGSDQFYRGYMDWAALDIEDDQMADAKVVSWAEEKLSQPCEQPLFLGVGIYRPHIPWYTPQAWFDAFPINSIEMPEVRLDDLSDVPQAGQAMSRRHWHDWMKKNGKWRSAVQGYLASVSFADAMIGRLLDALDAGPHADTTVIVLWSDHGYHLGHKEHWEKFALWEQTTHVPLIIVKPRSANSGKRCDRPASLLDIYPTLVELCGLECDERLDGQSLVPLLDDPAAASDRAVVTTQGIGNHAVRSQHWRYIRYANGDEELYNHQRDPHEFENLARDSDYDQTKRQLAEYLPIKNAALCPSQTKR
tara:strand:+ start:10556 stop:11980 length:1425 start_codon:yes stop_codon:yes gene_type:complete